MPLAKMISLSLPPGTMSMRSLLRPNYAVWMYTPLRPITHGVCNVAVWTRYVNDKHGARHEIAVIQASGHKDFVGATCAIATHT